MTHTTDFVLRPFLPDDLDALVEHAKGGGKSRAAEVVIPPVDEPEVPDAIDDGLELGN